ncbi:MAG: hypothetical protein MJY50_06950 [Bacteroidales bacterium]|nr:hypothetical protein [Bacteroidales bacterium]
MMNRGGTLLLTALCVLLASCVRPDTEEWFVCAEDAVNGNYLFDLDMTDSLATFDLSLYFRVDNLKSRGAFVPMNVSWYSPSSEKRLEETVYMECGNYSEGAQALYRDAVRPGEPGIWKINVRPMNPPVGFRGVGVIFTRNGTR